MKHLVLTLALLLLAKPAVAGQEIVLDAHDDMLNQHVLFIGEHCGVQFELNSEFSDEPNIFIGTPRNTEFTLVCLDGELGSLIESLEVNGEMSIPYEEPVEMAVERGVYLRRDAPAVNDPLYQFQWNLSQVNASAAWRRSTGKGVTVAVIDTGVAAKTGNEPKAGRPTKLGRDLEGATFVAPYDFVDDHKYPWDCHGHGTHVAGTIAQTTNNKFGVAGLAYDAQIMPLRVLGCSGSGTYADIAEAIRYAADNGADVINMSLGGPIPSAIIQSAINYAHGKGVTIVAAAGNSGQRAPSYPAAHENVIAVAATQFDQSTTFYSQRGPFVDIAAPGGNTQVDQNGDGQPDGIMQETLKSGKTDQHDFLLYMGTSMASPHVAAAAALLYATGTTNPDAVERALKSSALPKGDAERYGAGILQADGALQSDAARNTSARLGLTALLFALIAFTRKSVGIVAAVAAVVAGVGIGPVAAMPEWDLWLMGLHQTPVFASALLPVAFAIAAPRNGLAIAKGLAIGFGAFLLAESFLLTSDILWIPGFASTYDQLWLMTQGLTCVGVAAYLE